MCGSRNQGEGMVVQEGQYNIGHICTRQQCDLGRAEKTAMRWLPVNGAARDFSFADLDEQSSRFANLLDQCGFAPGDILFTFLPRCPEQFISFLGALKSRIICDVGQPSVK